MLTIKRPCKIIMLTTHLPTFVKCLLMHKEEWITDDFFALKEINKILCDTSMAIFHSAKYQKPQKVSKF